MKIDTFALGPLQTNAYLITNETEGTSLLIDPGMHPAALVEALHNTKLAAILLTHTHFDHIGGLEEIREKTGAPVYVHPSEQDWLTDGFLNGSVNWMDDPIACKKAEHELHDRQRLRLAGFDIDVFHTPGHSPGGVSFLIGTDLFSGDALFAGSIGRTDLRGGDYEQLITSIQDRLLILPDEVRVYPGHGPQTTIGREKDSNPFVTGLLR